jgi:hypothetical protein
MVKKDTRNYHSSGHHPSSWLLFKTTELYSTVPNTKIFFALCNRLQSHASSGIRTQDVSVGAGEDSSCLRPRGHCDQLLQFNIGFPGT